MQMHAYLFGTGDGDSNRRCCHCCTYLLACFVQVRESYRRMSVFLGAFGRGTGLVVENSQSTQRLALHVPLLCSFRFLPAHVCRMQLPILEPRDCFSRQAEVPPKFWNFGRHVCLGEEQKDLEEHPSLANNKRQTNWLDTQSKQHD